jgi:hypothetical protein
MLLGVPTNDCGDPPLHPQIFEDPAELELTTNSVDGVFGIPI